MDKSSGHAPVILFFRRSLCEGSRRELVGVQRFADGVGWNVQIVEFGSAADTRFHEGAAPNVDIWSLLSFWKPAGCIVECSGLPPCFRKSQFGRTPVVFLDTYPQYARGGVCVSIDSKPIAQLAAKELLSLGLTDYAYVSWPEDLPWNHVRHAEFKRIVKMNGRRFHAFVAKSKLANSFAFERELADWLATLPRPCGVFAANDPVAIRVVSACELIGLSVPDDIAVVGVDNERQLCESSAVSVTSVQIDVEGSGHAAAEVLYGLLGGRCRSTAVDPCGQPVLERRASTRRFVAADGRAVRALEYIRRHACEGIRRPDVIRTMGCSPRLADMRFREMTGHGILDEIHFTRLERAKSLLRLADLTLVDVFRSCGYSSVDDFKRVFRRYVGKTPSAWQKELR